MRLTYYDERVIEQLAARTQLTGEQTVVDVGTGTGFVAAGLAAHAHRVLGFDNARSMLEVARANMDRLDVDNVELAWRRPRVDSVRGSSGYRIPGAAV